MTNFNDDRYFKALNTLKAEVKGEHTDYMNMCIASGFAQNKEDKMTEDWLRRFLLGQVEDDFITYGQALAFAPIYREEIESLKAFFR